MSMNITLAINFRTFLSQGNALFLYFSLIPPQKNLVNLENAATWHSLDR